MCLSYLGAFEIRKKTKRENPQSVDIESLYQLVEIALPSLRLERGEF
jgi:hypothetical protein